MEIRPKKKLPTTDLQKSEVLKLDWSPHKFSNRVPFRATTVRHHHNNMKY